MVALSFRGPTRDADLTVGPAEYFRIARRALERGPDHSPIATHVEQVWEFHGRFFVRIDALGAVEYHFEDARGEQVTPSYGPVHRFSLVDGAIHCDGEIVALLDQLRDEWLHQPLEQLWPAVVICSSR